MLTKPLQPPPLPIAFCTLGLFLYSVSFFHLHLLPGSRIPSVNHHFLYLWGNWGPQKGYVCPKWDKLVNPRAKALTQAPSYSTWPLFSTPRTEAVVKPLSPDLSIASAPLLSLECYETLGNRNQKGNLKVVVGRVRFFFFFTVRDRDLKLREKRKLPQTQKSRRWNVEEKEKGNSSCSRI